MKQKSSTLKCQNSVFEWIALAMGAILLIPSIAMQITTEVAWGSTDFDMMVSLLFAMSSLCVLAAKKLPIKHQLFVGGMFVAAFSLIWAEFAVGVFANLGVITLLRRAQEIRFWPIAAVQIRSSQGI